MSSLMPAPAANRPAAYPALPENNLTVRALNRMTRDQDWIPKWGAPKQDIQNARRIIGEGPGGVDRLETALKAGAILPAVAAAIYGAALQQSVKQQ